MSKANDAWARQAFMKAMRDGLPEAIEGARKGIEAYALVAKLAGLSAADAGLLERVQAPVRRMVAELEAALADFEREIPRAS
jgi:hypothetical protein